MGAGLLVTALVGAAEPAWAGSARATLAVAATVARNCAVAAGPESVELRCTRGTQPLRRAPPLAGGADPTWQPATAAPRAGEAHRAALRAEASEPVTPGTVTVTLNF